MSTTPSNVTSAVNLADSFFTAYNAHDLSRMLSAKQRRTERVLYGDTPLLGRYTLWLSE